MKSTAEEAPSSKVIDFKTYLLRRQTVKKNRVLVVDDEEDVAYYFATLLESHGFTPTCSFSGEEALRAIEADPPDLILLDVMMPGRGGLNLFAHLKGEMEYQDIPVVFVTGIQSKMGGDFASFIQSRRVRVPEGYVQKPIDPEKFLQTVRNAMAQR